MANPNPYQARQGKKLVRKVGDMHGLLKKLWQAILEAERVLLDAPHDQPKLSLKACHALSQCCGQYANLLEIGELEARIVALEEAQKGTR